MTPIQIHNFQVFSLSCVSWHGARSKARGLQTYTQVHVVECLQFNATISLSVSALEANVNTVVLRLLFCIDLSNRSHLPHLKETIVALVQLRLTNPIRS